MLASQLGEGRLYVAQTHTCALWEQQWFKFNSRHISQRTPFANYKHSSTRPQVGLVGPRVSLRTVTSKFLLLLPGQDVAQCAVSIIWAHRPSQPSSWKVPLLGQPSGIAFFSATLIRPTDEFIFSACTVGLFLFQGTASSISSTVLPGWPNSGVSVLPARPWALESCLREFQNARM